MSHALETYLAWDHALTSAHLSTLTPEQAIAYLDESHEKTMIWYATRPLELSIQRRFDRCCHGRRT